MKVKFELDDELMRRYYYLLHLKALIFGKSIEDLAFNERVYEFAREAFSEILEIQLCELESIFKEERNEKKNEN